MFEKSEKTIIILLVVLVVIYFLQQKEHFDSDNKFRLRVKGTNNYLYNASFNGFRTTTSTGAYYILGKGNCLISKTGYTTSVYNNKCLYYKVINNPNSYLIDKDATNNYTNTNCKSKSPNYTGSIPLYFESVNGLIYYMSKDNKTYYLSNQKHNNLYYKFSSEKSNALQLEKV